MDRASAEVFNEEVERYRKSLLFYAKKCDWETFKAKAGRLFDYLEYIEKSEIERRFSGITRIIVIILFIVLLVIWKMHTVATPELEGMRRLVLLTALGISSFELYFFVNFKRYLDVKRSLYGKRRAQFIAGIEQDFKIKVSQKGTP